MFVLPGQGSGRGSEFGVLRRHYSPSVYVHASGNVPALVGADKEHEGVEVVAVKVLLVGHGAVVLAFYHEEVFEQVYSYDVLVVGVAVYHKHGA